jgi:hypothetical protein
MKKKRPAKLTPTASQAKYPTLIELRRESGRLFNGVAAAVLATGLAGCGDKAEEPLRTAGTVDASYFQQEVRLPGDTEDSLIPQPDGALMASGVIDVGYFQQDVRSDAGMPDGESPVDADLRTDAPDAGTPDTNRDQPVMIFDGLPIQPQNYDLGFDITPKDATDARPEDQRPAVDGSTDSDIDVK